MGDLTTYLGAMALAAALLVVSTAGANALGRAYIARIPFDWRADDRFRERNEGILGARTWDELRRWERPYVLWALSVFVAAAVFSVSEFSARFIVMYAGAVVVYLTVTQSQRRWNEGRQYADVAYQSKGQALLWHAAFDLLTFLWWAAFVALFAVAGIGLGDALNG